MLQQACDNPILREWPSSDRDEATTDTFAVQAVFDLLHAFRDDVSRVTGGAHASRCEPAVPLWGGGN